MLRTIRFCVACAFTRLREQQEQNKGNHYGPKKWTLSKYLDCSILPMPYDIEGTMEPKQN